MREDESAEAEESRRPRVVDKRVGARGERPEPAERARPADSAAPTVDPGAREPPETVETGAPPTAASAPPGDVWTPEQEAQARQLAEEIARTPGRDWVVHTAVNLANIAGFKLQEGQLPDAQVAIDALNGMLREVEGRLGDAEGVLRQTLAQLQLAYAQATQARPQ